MPILTPGGDLVGIIDAEAWAVNHFTNARIALIAKVSADSSDSALCCVNP